MKIKAMKYLYIIGGSIICLGIVLAAYSLSIVNFNFNMITTDSPFEDLNYVATGKIDKLSVNVNNAPVIINPTTENEITIEYKENNKYQYNITEQNGALSITQKETEFNILNFVFAINISSPKFIINVPEDIIYDLSIKTSNNTIQVNDLKTTNIKFETSNGFVTAENITTTNKIDIKTSNNKIELTNIVAKDIILVTSNGRIELDNVNSTNDIEATTSNNNIVIENTNCYDMNINTSNGVIDLSNLTIKNDITGSTSNSKIMLEAVNFTKNLNLTTSNGNITGDIKGKLSDFSFECTTSKHNESNLPESLIGGDKTIKLKTSNGNINIDFS